METVKVDERGKTVLEPSFWRTCRALNNRHRLDLLRDVFQFEGEFGVTEFGRRAGLSEPTASTYLRQLNARGLIGVRRERMCVYYNARRDRSLPKAVSLQSAFVDFFKQKPKGNWQDPLVRLLKGYTHFNRLRAIRFLASAKSATVKETARHMGVGVRGAYHHVRILVDSRIIEPVPGSDRYRLINPLNPIHRVLHNLSVACHD